MKIFQFFLPKVGNIPNHKESLHLLLVWQHYFELKMEPQKIQVSILPHISAIITHCDICLPEQSTENLLIQSDQIHQYQSHQNLVRRLLEFHRLHQNHLFRVYHLHQHHQIQGSNHRHYQLNHLFFHQFIFRDCNSKPFL